jgi:hypothetical protein
MSEFDVIADILKTVRLNHNVPHHVSPFSTRVPLTGTRASQRVTHGRPHHTYALCIDPALAPTISRSTLWL